MWFLDLINGYSNLIIAFLAFLAFSISILQARDNRKHNRVSVTPALCDWLDTGDVYFNFSVANNGIGPAIIKGMSVFVDDNKLIVDRDRLIPEAVELVFSDYPKSVIHAHINNGYIVAVNEKIDIAKVDFTALESPGQEEIRERLKRIRVVIDYTSAYDEPYKLDTNENRLPQTN